VEIRTDGLHHPQGDTMYDSELDAMNTLRLAFERQLAAGEPEVRSTAMEYMTALATFVDAFNDGPGADPRRMGHDTTGALNRVAADVVRAEAERHRVRAVLNTLH
jgi:hypothetical protein